MRFGKENRLRLAREIEFLKENSVKADCSAFIIYVYPQGLRKDSRIAIIASKRIGNAVTRNSARRAFREIFRACVPEFPQSADILVFVRRGWLKFEFESLKKKFGQACVRAIENYKPRPNAPAFPDCSPKRGQKLPSDNADFA